MKWKIADVEIENQVVLAPMAGLCDSSFRCIVKSMGCGLIETEMVSVNGLCHENRRTEEMLYMTDYERPISQQIFGSDPEAFREAAEYLYSNMKPDIIDINMGCPVTKVAVKSNAGSGLLKNPDLVYKIVEATVNATPTPVTVKIRSGWDKNTINYPEISKTVEEAGASAITVHPRTRTESYGTAADWNIIRDVKDTLKIPVIGNGDIKTCYDAKAMLDLTGCDAVMIGRAALGNPWLIRESVDYIDNGIKPGKISPDERMRIIRKHADLLYDTKIEKVARAKLREHAAYYLKGLPGSVHVKPKIFKLNTKDEILKFVSDYLYSLHDNTLK